MKPNKDTFTRNETKLEFETRLVKKGKIIALATRDWYIQTRKLEKLIYSLEFHTSFLNGMPSITERWYCLKNDLLDYPKCEKCGKSVFKFMGNGLKQYRKTCSTSCAVSIGLPKRTDEAKKRINKKRALTMRERGHYQSKPLMNVWTDAARNKRKATNMAKYGVENPGVLGAYSSKAAYNFIVAFLKENKIEENRCYFKWGGVNKLEFFQSSSKDGKREFISYDLVVFRDSVSALARDKDSIELILEYNGPWHYTKEQAEIDPNGKATPYPKSKTKMQTYQYDEMKFMHMKDWTKRFFVFWEKEGKLQTRK